jgi:hypothetical protein
MKSVTQNEMIETIRNNVHGASMVTVELDSPMDGKGKMRKTGNPFFGMGIVKRETLNGTIGYIYANAVNRIANKEGKERREAQQHPWGDMDEKHLFRVHRKTGSHYLSMQVKNATVHGFFTPDGKQIPDDEIRPFIPEKTRSWTQSDLEAEVIARDYGIDNIKSIRAFGEDYRIETRIEVEMERVEKSHPIEEKV